MSYPWLLGNAEARSQRERVASGTATCGRPHVIATPVGRQKRTHRSQSWPCGEVRPGIGSVGSWSGGLWSASRCCRWGRSRGHRRPAAASPRTPGEAELQVVGGFAVFIWDRAQDRHEQVPDGADVGARVAPQHLRVAARCPLNLRMVRSRRPLGQGRCRLHDVTPLGPRLPEFLPVPAAAELAYSSTDVIPQRAPG